MILRNFVFSGFLLSGFIVLAVWELVWKGLGLWRAARNNENAWFIAILIFNTAGILPIVYLIISDRRGKK